MEKKLPYLMEKVLLIGGIASILYFAALFVYLDFRVGFHTIWLILGIVLLAGGILLRRLPDHARQTVGSVLLPVMAIVLAVLLVFGGVIAAAQLGKPAADADYLVLLGARVKPEGPSLLLQYRIDRAAEYLQANEGTVAILCGAQGNDEPMSEAQAMYDGLIAQGIDPERLIMEDQSTDTEENIRNAMALMEGENPSVVLTTTGYHMCRALRTAKRLGLSNITGNSSESAIITMVNYYVREMAALARDILLR